MNESGHYRGIHLVVFNTFHGYVDSAKVFDTYKSSDLFEDFIINHPIPDGFLVFAACMDECTFNMSEKVKEWFEDMGSQLISKL